MNDRIRTGFTLIELLIVVAIIAVLAAIAVPNFLEAQTRSKTSRVKSDHRILALGLESYCVDENQYPPSVATLPVGECWQRRLTTPLAYLSTICPDVFVRDHRPENDYYQYGFCNRMKSYMVVSVGPDGIDLFNESMWMCGMRPTYPLEYDPTNGTVSAGDVWRVSKQGGPVPN